MAAETGEGLAVGPQIARLAFALDGHGQQQGECVFARAGGAGEDQRMRQPASGNSRAERFDGVRVPEELVEVGGQ